MRIGLTLSYAGGFREAADEVVELEQVGLDVVAVSEVYGFDAVSQLGYLAARTSRITLMSGVMQLFTRTPTLTAMTAAGLDSVSEGRFELGLGASGPQVIEGFHGVPYDAPVARTREIVDICRAVWRREPLVHAGTKYQIPLAEGLGTGLGKPLKLINQPVREQIPIVLAALGPKAVEQAAEIADGWMPVFFHPERAADVWGGQLAAGAALRDPSLGTLDIIASPALAITDEPERVYPRVKPHLALYIGGMGARGRNFYNDLVCGYGFEREAANIQELYLAGKKDEAAAAVPDRLVRDVSLIGPAGFVAERVAAFAAAGVTTLMVSPLAPDRAAKVALISGFRQLIG
ncbi:MAG TPA: LLM class F420-dependent oxidoreductase [Candidatus Lumbricidophila sp.]|nr:LLM class F420-dependent oxidoreductase [Candidatus Lumbricidophila sp.]